MDLVSRRGFAGLLVLALFLAGLPAGLHRAAAAGEAYRADGGGVPVVGALAQTDETPPTQGRTLYVDPNGSDDGDGSEAAPWRTIQRAAAEVAAGDTVLINPGTYEGGVTVSTDGTTEAPITFRGNGPDVVIEGSGGERDAFYIEAADDIIVEGLTIRNATRAGLRVSLSNRVTIRDSTFADNGTWGIFTDFSDDLLIEGNDASGSREEHGIYVSNSGDRPIVRGNRVRDNIAGGIQLNADASSGGDGIISGALIEGNVVSGNGETGGAAFNLDGVEGAVIRNNLLFENRATGIALFQGDGAVCSRDNLVLNNTIVMAADSRWAVLISPAADCTGNQLFNNVIHAADPMRGSISIPVADLAGFASDYNLLVDRFSVDDEGSMISLADWQALGYDANSRLAAPEEVFVDPAGGDFRLRPDSPAIDAGTPPPIDVPTDLDGNARPTGGSFDIGAYEFVGTGIVEPIATAAPTLAPPTPASSGTQVAIRLSERDGSGVSGLAVLTPQDGGTAVTLLVNGAAPGVVLLVDRGSCGGGDLRPAFVLPDLDATGRSESVLDIDLAALLGEPHAIAVYAGAGDLGTIVACGDVAVLATDAGAGTAVTPTPPPAPTQTPPVPPAASPDAETASPAPTAAPVVEGGAAASGSGQIVYEANEGSLESRRVYRIAANEGATPEDIGLALDALGPTAPDDWIGISPDGEWLLLGTERFDPGCAGWPCLAVVPADLSSGEAVLIGGQVVHTDGFGAIASGGTLIVYPAGGGPHVQDLWAITRQGDGWSEPLLLTGDSPYAFQHTPALAADGTRVVFDCGDRPYAEEGTAICEVGTDGSGFRVVLTPAEAPSGPVGGALHHPDYALDGGIVFQTSWSGAILRLPPGEAQPEPVGPAFADDTSPCVLADGRVASVWLGRPGNQGFLELKVMTPDGAAYVMLVTGIYVEDIGCGG